jgi:hypothetical protein
MVLKNPGATVWRLTIEFAMFLLDILDCLEDLIIIGHIQWNYLDLCHDPFLNQLGSRSLASFELSAGHDERARSIAGARNLKHGITQSAVAAGDENNFTGGHDGRSLAAECMSRNQDH